MTVVTTLDIAGLTPAEYRAVMDELGVERQPEPGIYLHLTTPIPDGFRVIELWDRQEGFERFAERRLTPATQATGVDRPTAITVTPLHNLFAPRLKELPAAISALPGAPSFADQPGTSPRT
jgi:hypothetical protein